MSEAAIVGNAPLLEALLEAGADVESPNADGQTALMVVARTSQVDAARAAAAARRQRQRGRAVARADGADVGGGAEAAGDGARARSPRGADVNARSTVNNWQRQVTAEPRAIYRPAGGLTPLLYAAREGCVECARALVDAGADLNLADPGGHQPAADGGHQHALRHRRVSDPEGREPEHSGTSGAARRSTPPST